VVALRFAPSKPFKLRSSIILKIVQIVQWYYKGKTKSLRSSVTKIFSFGAVKLLLNLRNISVFIPTLVTRTPVRESPLLSKCFLKLTESFWIRRLLCFFGIEHLLQKVSCRVDFMAGVLSNYSEFALLYKTAVVFKTPQSALWSIWNTTERVVALYFEIIPWKLDSSLTRRYFTAIFGTNLFFPIFKTTKRFMAYLKDHEALCGSFKVPLSSAEARVGWIRWVM